MQSTKGPALRPGGNIRRHRLRLRLTRLRVAATRAGAPSMTNSPDHTPPADYMDPAELASWTMLANAVLSADAAIVKD